MRFGNDDTRPRRSCPTGRSPPDSRKTVLALLCRRCDSDHRISENWPGNGPGTRNRQGHNLWPGVFCGSHGSVWGRPFHRSSVRRHGGAFLDSLAFVLGLLGWRCSYRVRAEHRHQQALRLGRDTFERHAFFLCPAHIRAELGREPRRPVRSCSAPPGFILQRGKHWHVPWPRPRNGQNAG
jgi:hypothetical protein